MRFLIVGAGGVGSVAAGYLARGGHDVVMLARPKHAEAVQGSGLNIRGLKDFNVKLTAVTDATDVKETDVLILTVKAKDTDVALENVKHLHIGCAFSLQNGLEKNKQLIEMFGRDKVVGATTMIGATLLKDGEVNHTLNGVTFLGELNGKASERINNIVSAFIASGLNASVADDITSIEWTKQGLQIPMNTLSAITRLPIERLWQNPNLAQLVVKMFREFAAVARANGIFLSDHAAWSLYDIKTLRDGTFHEATQSLVELGEKTIASGSKSIIPSMLKDVLDRKQTEVEENVAYILAESDRLNISTPCIEFALNMVRAIQENYGTSIRSSRE